MDFLAAAHHLAAEATPCHTPGAQYHTLMHDHQVGETVDLPPTVTLTPEQAALVDTDMHNVLELVLAPYFRTSALHQAADLSSDMSMDPTMQDAALPTSRTWGQPRAETDNLDPAAPGGPAPYNAAPPFGKPVTTDQMWLDPQATPPHKYQPLPHIKGPDVDVTVLKPASRTLHTARRESYEGKAARYARTHEETP